MKAVCFHFMHFFHISYVYLNVKISITFIVFVLYLVFAYKNNNEETKNQMKIHRTQYNGYYTENERIN